MKQGRLLREERDVTYKRRQAVGKGEGNAVQLGHARGGGVVTTSPPLAAATANAAHKKALARLGKRIGAPPSPFERETDDE